MTREISKDAASLKALESIKDGMKVGLGTGSTSSRFILHLIERCKKGLSIEAVATSAASEKMAREGGIPLLDIYEVDRLDIAVDGADEVDPKKRLIKGAGSALLREKIIAAMAKEMIVIADETKLVEQLGKMPLPVEIIPFGSAATKRHLEALGFYGRWRQGGKGRLFTDNQNWILDIALPFPLEHPEKANELIRSVPGVVETGFFFNLATRIIVGKEDGSAFLYL